MLPEYVGLLRQDHALQDKHRNPLESQSWRGRVEPVESSIGERSHVRIVMAAEMQGTSAKQ